MTGPTDRQTKRTGDSGSHSAPKLPPRIERRVRISRILLGFEALLPALWPAGALAGAFISLALFGLFADLPVGIHWVLLAGFGASLVWLIWHGFRGFRWPGRQDALRHLEKSSGLPHAPLSAYEDVPAAQSGDAALWAAHRRWIAERLGRLRLGLPDSVLASTDPYALRAAILLLLVVSIAGTGPGHFARIADALLPGATGGRVASIEAWVTPPAYTRKPPLYLEQANAEVPVRSEAITVPQGSTLSIRVHGLRTAPVLERHDGEREKPEELKLVSDGNFSIDAVLKENADLLLTEGGRMIRGWRFEVTPDTPPAIELTQPVTQSASGALRLSYRVTDDYGVVSGEARVELDRSGMETEGEKISAPESRVTAPGIALKFPVQRPREAEGTTYAELTAHPWAGLPVKITLAVKDDAGQEGMSEPVTMVLPERTFTQPLARAIVEQRRRLALDPRSGASVARYIDNFTQDSDRYIEDKVVYLTLRAAYWRLTEATRDTDLTGIFDLLWSIALRIEDGDLSLAERDLRAAREALTQALAEGADAAEITRLMQELREAFDRYMNAISELAAFEGSDMQSTLPDGEAEYIAAEDLQAMLDAIGELAESGATEQAQALLAELQNILENLKLSDPSAGMSPGEEALARTVEEMDNLIAAQRDLLDRTFRELESLRLDPDADRKLGQQSRERPFNDIAGDQEELKQEFEKILEKLRESGEEPPEALAEALDAMSDAKDRLEAARADRAMASQGTAIEKMRDGAQTLADKLLENRAGKGRGRGQARSDPFGRPQHGRGAGQESGPGDMRGSGVPDNIDMQRAQQILDELRERARDLGRPQIELDYLERLLRRF
ncbi:MAG: TIGR02302 family protein [Pseudomonadota bacterium]